MSPPDLSLAEWRRRSSYAGSPLFLGAGTQGLAFARKEQGILVLGPPRSGKTTSLVIPNLLLAPGPVVATSTKADVLVATAPERLQMGRCWLFDPSGRTRAPPGVTQLRWSPVVGCESWDTALRTARAMTLAARPAGYHGDQGHWTERAEALIAPLLHAAAISQRGMDGVNSWVLQHELQVPRVLLERSGGSPTATDSLVGLEQTDDRERSGILSTAAGVLAAYKSDQAIAQAREPNFDPKDLPGRCDTVYVCASGQDQGRLAPLVIGLLEQVRAAAYQWSADAAGQGRWAGPPLALVLDEAANIAPLPDLPSIVSEGGSQGLVTMACFQDLSQARARWGQAADGFMTLFGNTVALGGIKDVATLQKISELGGEVEVPHKSVTRPPLFLSLRQPPSVTHSTRRVPRLPVNDLAQLPQGTALLLSGAEPPSFLRLTPWFQHRPFLEAERALGPPALVAQRSQERSLGVGH